MGGRVAEYEGKRGGEFIGMFEVVRLRCGPAPETLLVASILGRRTSNTAQQSYVTC